MNRLAKHGMKTKSMSSIRGSPKSSHNMALNRTACKLRLQVPSAFGSGGQLALR